MHEFLSFNFPLLEYFFRTSSALPTGSFARQTYRPPRQPEACEPFFYKNCLDASYQVCIAKCLPEIDDLPKNVYKITVQECKSPHPVDV